jgi:mono/diheme cytochrome c family protein
MGLLVPLGFVGTTAATETAFKENCAKCHARAASVARSVQGNTEQERRKALDQLLRSHHAEDPTLRAEVVDYLIGLSGQ